VEDTVDPRRASWMRVNVSTCEGNALADSLRFIATVVAGRTAG
jgi:hypothetical protein